MDTKEDKHPIAVVRMCSEGNPGFSCRYLSLAHCSEQASLSIKKLKTFGQTLCSLPSVLFQEGTKAHEELGSRT